MKQFLTCKHKQTLAAMYCNLISCKRKDGNEQMIAMRQKESDAEVAGEGEKGKRQKATISMA